MTLTFKCLEIIYFGVIICFKNLPYGDGVVRLRPTKTVFQHYAFFSDKYILLRFVHATWRSPNNVDVSNTVHTFRGTK